MQTSKNNILFTYTRRCGNKYTNLISNICNINCLFDRFGIIGNNKIFTYDRSPILTNKSLKEISLERAEQIVSVANGRKINILFSGGVDSITVAALLYNTGYKNIRIIECISEEHNDIFREWFVGKGVDFITVDREDMKIDFYDSIFISGDCADQMHHCGAMFNSNQEKNIKTLFKDEEFASWISGFPCDNDMEKLWLLSYCFKWRESQYSHIPLFVKRVFHYKVNPNDYCAFFSGDECSDWAYSNFKETLKADISNPLNYKKEWKDIAIGIIKDARLEDAIKTKPKVFSTSSLIDRDVNAYTIWFNNMDEHVTCLTEDKKVVLKHYTEIEL